MGLAEWHVHQPIKMNTIVLALPKLSCNISICKHHLESLIRDPCVVHYFPYNQTSLSLSHSLTSKYSVKLLEMETIEETHR